MKFNRYLLCMFTMLSVCFGQDEDSIVSNTATLRVAMRFAVEVPFNNVALNTVPDGLTVRQSIAHILTQKGIFGFYSGAQIEVLRSVLWYPRMQLMKDPWRISVPSCELEYYRHDESGVWDFWFGTKLETPRFIYQTISDNDVGDTTTQYWYNPHLTDTQPKEFNKAEIIRRGGSYFSAQLGFVEYDHSLSVAANLAAFEMIIMPLFRIRNACMLYPWQSILKKASYIGETLYAGSTLRGGTTFASWYTFFKAQDYAKEHWEGDPLLQGAFTTGTQMVVGGVTAPFYVVMINRQKLTNPCALPFWTSLRETYLKQGAQVFTRSAKFGAAHASLQAALTVGVFSLCGEK